MTYKLLLDECLSPQLLEMAHEAGHVESTCVRDRDWLGLPDHVLIGHVVEEDFTFVTLNARDFRGSADGPVGGLHARQDIHAGLICINSAADMDLDRQRDLFQVALNELETVPDLVNKALEIFEDDDGQIEIITYEIPQADVQLPDN